VYCPSISEVTEVQKVWKFRRFGSSEGLEVQKVWKFRRFGSSEGSEVWKVRKFGRSERSQGSILEMSVQGDFQIGERRLHYMSFILCIRISIDVRVKYRIKSRDM